MKKLFNAAMAVVLAVTLAGCSALQSKINSFTGSLIGTSYTIRTYDNYGNLVLTTNGKKISISGNTTEKESVDSSGNTITSADLTSVLTIEIDGKEMQSCGDTLIFTQSGLDAEVDFSQETIDSSSSVGGFASVSSLVNEYKNKFGKSRVVVIKSQLGQPIVAYSGDKVYWEIPEELPKMTKLMIDGKAVYIHRANFQIIDAKLLK